MTVRHSRPEPQQALPDIRHPVRRLKQFVAPKLCFGAAQGLRQPVHVEDVASACIAALQSASAANHAYDLSGAEKLTYREMVARVFRATDKLERFIAVPLPVFRLAIACLRIWPRFRSWSVAMAERMNADQVFDHADAIRNLGFSPRPFRPGKADLPNYGSSNLR